MKKYLYPRFEMGNLLHRRASRFYLRHVFCISKAGGDLYRWLLHGGYGSWYLALSHPDLYSKTASMSGAVDIARLYTEAMSGQADGSFQWDLIYCEGPGGHNWDFWDVEIKKILDWMMKEQRLV